MKTYDTIIDLLNFEGPGLQDYVTPDELGGLLIGAVTASSIADRYLDDLAHTELVAVATGPAQTRADLLTWIKWEIEIAAQQGEEADALDELAAHAAAEERENRVSHAVKMVRIQRAREAGLTKEAIARTLGTTRPTLDKWISNYEAELAS
ncbi:helix-turn-helix domain-containing protein [Streptomyces sp. NPDC059928]|uniref:helix-turn-helix domain-containing protein n=1 Tax=unclassified Streptomyces TaxID=2593676 RepID=UPI003647E28D